MMELTRELLSGLPMSLRIEIEENALRKDLTQSELAQLQERVLSLVRQQTKQGQRTDLDATSGKAFPEVKQEPERATEAIGRLFGESGKQVHKRLAVVKAAKEDPDQFAKLKEDMDRTGLVNGPFKRLKIMRQSAAIRAAPPPLPGRGPYRVIVADPPWHFESDEKQNPERRAAKPYPLMTTEQICQIDVAAIAHGDCLLWLWTTNFHMREAFTVLDAWGFKQKTILTWAKDRMGLGDWLRGQTEHCLLAVRGKPIVELTNQTTLLHGVRRKNSQKPAEFYGFVERLCPAPRYAYLFSRYRYNEYWDCHGDEAPK
jgi:N6-adenosine-specific RNA methylase IME4